ncbi:MAG TPA: TldD/PmbA family protein [Clostridia bacterium]|nr:TldD/PmbA family protein [Clostridia bacterium]
MIDKELLSDIIKTSLLQGGDFADVFFEKKELTAIGCEEGKIETVHSGLEMGVGIRVIRGEVTSYGFTNDLSRDGLLGAAKIVSQASQGIKREVNLDFNRPQTTVDFKILERPEDVTSAKKVRLVRDIELTAREVDRDRVKQVIVAFGDVVQNVIILNSDGEYIEDERVRTRMVIQVVAAENDIIQTGFETAGGFSGFELFKEVSPKDLAQTAAKRAVLMLTAKPAPSGKMPVIMASEAGGTMIHEACGHGLEADLAQRKLSVYAGKKGEQVAAKSVTVIDDATIPGKYGSYRFDDEGVPAQKCVLIENGVLTDYMYDRLTATKDNRSSNGHGRRESYQHRPIPRMANTYVEPGKEDPQEIIKACKKGLLVRKMGGGQVNTATGDFVFDVAEGYLIEGGEVGPLVRGATLTGNGPEVLREVEMVGNDLGFTIGTCGKDGQGVPVGDAQPTLYIKEMLIGGTSG